MKNLNEKPLTAEEIIDDIISREDPEILIKNLTEMLHAYLLFYECEAKDKLSKHSTYSILVEAIERIQKTTDRQYVYV